MSNASKYRDRAPAGSVRELQILVIQSNPADTMLTVEAFKVAGLTTGLHCVTDGKDALMYVRREGKYANVGVPDLIFLDLSQPRLSGLKVLKTIKSTQSLTHIPIVVAAGSDNPEFIWKVYTLNGNCFMRKPEELTEFARSIKACCEFWGSVITLPAHRPSVSGIG